MEFNHYQVLGVSPHATEEEIKAAFKSLAKKYHPDKHAGNVVYEEHFKKINAAYQTLSDSTKRKRYDQKLFYKNQPSSQPSQNRQRSQQRPVYRPMRKKETTPEEKRRNIKYASLVVAGLLLFIIGAIYFADYMNSITAKDYLTEGKLMQAQNKDLFAMQYYSEAIGYDESLSEAYLLRAGLRIKLMKDYHGAILDYSKILEQKEDPEIYFKRAKCHIQLKKYEEVMNDLNKAITLNPKFDTLYFYKGEVNNYILKKYAEAIKDYDKTLALNPKFNEALLGRGISKQNILNYKGSINDFNTLIQMKPEEGSYYYYRAYSKFYLKDTSSACNDWFQAERLYFIEARNLLNKYCLGK